MPPSLDDAPVVHKITGADVAADDLIQIYDVSAQRPKTITIAQLIVALDALDAGALADS
jgi:hypothetical protein